MEFVVTKEVVELFHNTVQSQSPEAISEITKGYFPADLSYILEELEEDAALYVLDHLEPSLRSDVFIHFEEDIQSKLLESIEPALAAEIISNLDSDDAVDILSLIDLKFRDRITQHITNEEKLKQILDLIQYDQDCAGGLMAKEFIRANLSWTVSHCIEEIRRQAENVDKLYSIYVMDKEEKLVGRVSVKKLLISSGNSKIEEIFVNDIIYVHTYDSKQHVADIIQKYDIETVPVVNVKGKMLGLITVDDVIDVIMEKAELEQRAMAGISENIDEYDSVWKLSRARLPWLFIGMLGGLIGARFIGIFEKDLIAVPAMSFFIPLIMATGGNVGIQSSTIIVQSLSDPNLLHESLSARLLKALSVAILNGIIIGSVALTFNAIFTESISLAIVVSIALFCVVIVASIMGTLTPILLDRANINPALASGPFITTANDLLGLAIYFFVARLLISLHIHF